MSRLEAPTIRFGRVVVDVQWRDTGYDRGIAVTISVAATSRTMSPVAKLDAFERHPHWHHWLPAAGEDVVPLSRADPMAETYELLSALRQLLEASGHADVADALTGDDVDVILDRTRRAIDSVTP
jgi:hypothetical protein